MQVCTIHCQPASIALCLQSLTATSLCPCVCACLQARHHGDLPPPTTGKAAAAAGGPVLAKQRPAAGSSGRHAIVVKPSASLAGPEHLTSHACIAAHRLGTDA